MPAVIDLTRVLSFLADLRRNNARPWFEVHRSDYEVARDEFARFVDVVIDGVSAFDDLQGVGARDCIARIYRDVRFSKDKSPYKTNLGAMIAPGGWKTTALGYYVSLEPAGSSMVAGGLHHPLPEQLARFREAVATDAAEFRRLTREEAFVSAFGGIWGEKLKTAPKGYDPAHPDIDLLRLKQVAVVHRFLDEEVTADDFAQRVVALCRTMQPFLTYLRDVTD